MQNSGKRQRQSIEFNEWVTQMYPNEVNELRKKQMDDEDRLVSARTFTFQVTDKCNLACTYCYQINKSTRRMPIETAKLAVDKLLSGVDGFGEYLGKDNAYAIIIEFIGGEPFLEIDLIDEVVDYFREQAILLDHPWAEKFMISICSNGVLYKDPKVQKFLEKNKYNLSFSVTVDGIKELHDACRIFPDGKPSYDLAHGAAMDWMSRGYYMGSKITIAPGNITYLSKSLKQMIEDGYDDINANTVFEEGWTQEHATELFKQIKDFSDWFISQDLDAEDFAISLLSVFSNGPMLESENNNWCGGTGSMLSMDPDGRLFPCIRYMESSLGDDQKPLCIGDVWSGIAKRQCEQDCLHCMDNITRRSQSEDQCFNCVIANGCAWCSAHNYQVFGTINKRATFSCEMHKARMMGIVYFWNSYYKKKGINKVVDMWVPEQWAVPIIGKEQYDELVKLTDELGGYVNKNNSTMVRVKDRETNYKGHEDKIEYLD